MFDKVRDNLDVIAVIGVACLLAYWFVAATELLAGSKVRYSGYDGAVLVSTDGRTLTVGGFGAPCFGSVAAEAQQDARRVAVRLRYTIPSKHGPCAAAMGMVPGIDVHLDAPLGTRALVDAEDGRVLPRFDAGRMLHPRRLPVGYAFDSVAVPLIQHSAAGEWAQAGCIQFYRSRGGGVFFLSQMIGPLAGPAVERGGRTSVQVRGHPGQADADSVTWSEDGQTMRLVIDALAYSPSAGERDLTVEDLIALADGAT